jgi:hypothetical protein
MESLVPALQSLLRLYDELARELARGSASTAAGPAPISRDRLQQLQQMSPVIDRLMEQWRAGRGRMGFESEARVSTLIAAARERGEQLSHVCEDRHRHLQQYCRNLEASLGALYTGRRYLASLSPAKTNFPKFIDSIG